MYCLLLSSQVPGLALIWKNHRASKDPSRPSSEILHSHDKGIPLSGGTDQESQASDAALSLVHLFFQAFSWIPALTSVRDRSIV